MRRRSFLKTIGGALGCVTPSSLLRPGAFLNPATTQRRGKANVAVVGAGIFGMAAAIELRKRGHEVTMFEQGGVPYERASSTDVSKFIRRLWYNDTYIELVERSGKQWRIWHDQLSQNIYNQTGILNIVQDFTPGNSAYDSFEILEVRGASIEILSPKEVRSRYPQFVIHDNETGVFDPWGGYLRSAQSLADLAELARSEGIQIHEKTAVTQLDEGSDGVSLASEGRWPFFGRWRDSQTFDRVVVAAGPWISKLAPHLGQKMEITLQQMAFFEPPDPKKFAPDIMPIWSIGGSDFYGFPLLPEGFVKVANGRGPVVHPDAERIITPEFVERAKAFVADRMPELARGRFVGGRSCLYTRTPDGDFVIDFLPGSERILVAGGGSGHGFKFGGSIGPVIADALEEKDHSLGGLFRIGDRFD